jgi:hypothetical protein
VDAEDEAFSEACMVTFGGLVCFRSYPHVTQAKEYIGKNSEAVPR